MDRKIPALRCYYCGFSIRRVDIIIKRKERMGLLLRDPVGFMNRYENPYLIIPFSF